MYSIIKPSLYSWYYNFLAKYVEFAFIVRVSIGEIRLYKLLPTTKAACIPQHALILAPPPLSLSKNIMLQNYYLCLMAHAILILNFVSLSKHLKLFTKLDYSFQ